jgi:hypothetical protein
MVSETVSKSPFGRRWRGSLTGGVFAAYWKSGASGSQSHSESQDITAAHPPLPRSKSKPPSKTTRAVAATTRGKRALKVAEDEDESIDLDISNSKDLDDDEMDEDEDTFAAAPAPRATRNAKAPKKPASKATPKSSKTTKAKVTAARKGKGKQPALFLSDPSDEGEGDDTGAADFLDVSDGGDSALVSELVGDDREAAMTSTLRSTAGTQVRRTAARAVKKRPVALVDRDDGDSDDDAVFKGFGGRKRGRTG